MKYDALLVFLGGGIGSSIRWILGLMLPYECALSPSTILANSIASFMAGLLAGFISRNMISKSAGLFLSVGVMGGISTFSTYVFAISSELSGLTLFSVCLFLITLVVGLALAAIGLMLGSKLFNHSSDIR